MAARAKKPKESKTEKTKITKAKTALKIVGPPSARIAFDLLKMTNVVVKFPQTAWANQPGVSHYENVPGGKLIQDTVIVLRANKYNNKGTQVIYWTESHAYEQSMIMPNDLPVEIIEGAEKLWASYEKWQLQNLPAQLNYGYTSGSDPEIFVETAKGELIPAFNFLGSKENPNKIGTNTIYWDGFQGEFTVGANNCCAFMLDSVQTGLKGLLDAARKFDPKAKLSAKTVFDIPIPLIRESKPEHVAFGCNASLNAYGMKGLEEPGNQVFYRSAGGHIHLGFMKVDDTTMVNIVKALDAILGVAGVSLFAKFDDPRRRQMYGLAGEYRTPSHGLEYRVLSNAWMFHPLIANIVYDLARPAATFGWKGMMKHWKATEAETIKAINDCDVPLAREILTRNKDLLIIIMRTKMGDRANYAYDVIMNGMESVIANPTDIEGNWLLDAKRWKTHCNSAGRNITNASELFMDGIRKV